MLGDPGMVRRALERQVEGDLDLESGGGVHQLFEIGERPELGVHRGVAALVPSRWPTGCPGSPGSARTAPSLPLRLTVPIGWMGGR